MSVFSAYYSINEQCIFKYFYNKQNYEDFLSLLLIDVPQALFRVLIKVNVDSLN